MLAAFRQPTVSWAHEMSPEHIDLHRMVDRLDPDQVRALRTVAQQLLRPSTRAARRR
jgi:hypothetical protein